MFQRFFMTLGIIFILLLFIHMKMKKMLIGAFLGMFAVAGIAVLPNYADANRKIGDDQVDDFEKQYEWWNAQDTQYNAWVAWSTGLKQDSLVHTIKNAINWVLGILSLIALALCLWGGFQMMTSGGDSKKYESGLNILKWAAIGLAIIATSWLIVSLIFYVIDASIGNDVRTDVNKESYVAGAGATS